MNPTKEDLPDKNHPRPLMRITIYPKDIMIITGRSERHARYLVARIRKTLNKTPDQFITIDEFCTFTGLQKEKILPLLTP